MFKIKRSIIYVIGLLTLIVGAQAVAFGQEMGASSVIAKAQGQQLNGDFVAAGRSNPNNALGDPNTPPQMAGQETFFSLGFGGSITLGYSCAIIDGPGPDIRVYENTNLAPGEYPLESASVFAVLDPMTNTFVATATNAHQDPVTGLRVTDIDLSGTGVFSTSVLLITDVTDKALFENDPVLYANADGFDVNAVMALHTRCAAPVIATCDPTTNPAGKNIPPATNQNPDGFYILGANGAPNLKGIYISDTGSNTTFGPFPEGTKIKLIQAPGAVPQKAKGPGVIDWQIRFKGDALVYGVDVFDNHGANASCRVPPLPK